MTSRPGMARRWATGLVAMALALFAGAAVAQLDPASEARRLIVVIEANTGLDGDIAARLDAEQALAEIGGFHPEIVVPLLTERLATPRDDSSRGQQRRLAVLDVLERMGPAAAAARDTVAAIAADTGEPNEYVRAKAEMTLARIGAAAPPPTQRPGGDRPATDGPLVRWLATGPLPECADAALFPYRRFAGPDGVEDFAVAVSALPGDCAIAVGRPASRHADDDIALAGIAVLFRHGAVDDMVPPLAAVLARRDDGARLLTALGWSAVHTDRMAVLDAVIDGLAAHLRDPAQTYSAAERARLEALLGQAAGSRRR